MHTVTYQLKGERVVVENFRCAGDADDFVHALKKSLGDRVVKCEVQQK